MSAEKKRQPLEAGGWFNLLTSEKIAEGGLVERHIRKEAALYRTHKGGWVLCIFGIEPSDSDKWREFSPIEAVEWLIQNNQPVPEDLEGYAEEQER